MRRMLLILGLVVVGCGRGHPRSAAPSRDTLHSTDSSVVATPVDTPIIWQAESTETR
jgi:hypothetical protein